MNSAGSKSRTEKNPERAQTSPAPPHRAVTIQDVALAAGVSNMTVSNVINERDARVGESTRQRVLKVINELGYRVSLPARQLRQGRTGMIGLAVPFLASFYYGELADRLVQRFAQHGLRLVIERTGGALEGELAALAVSHLDAYDGLVLMVTQGQTHDLEAIDPSKPVVFIGERALSHRYDHILMDNVGGAELATRRLIETGSKRILLLGGEVGDDESMPTLRTKGYISAHRALGVPVDNRLIVASSFGARDGHAMIHRLSDIGLDFDAVFALTDDSAMGVLSALSELEVRVPQDVQVFGWDDVSWGRYMVPSLSTVAPANDAIADAVVETLRARIAGATREPSLVTPPASLILRQSTR
jgi:DNA-binding LacI/PurR family transcriptional regulator